MEKIEREQISALNTDKVEGFEYSTIKEFGNKLPSDPTRIFTIKEFRGKEEKEIRKLIGRRGSRPEGMVTVHRAVSSTLSVLVDTLDGVPKWKEMTHDQKKNTLNLMYQADVTYMFVIVRRETLGSNVRVAAECVHCGEIGNVDFSLDELDVAYIKDSDKVIETDVELEEPVSLGGKEFKTVKVTPVQFYAAEKMVDEGTFDIVVAKHSCYCLDGTNKIPIPEDIAENMLRRDLLRLQAAINDKQFGTQVTIPYQCERCFKVSLAGLDMNYETFFDVSFLSKQMKTIG